MAGDQHSSPNARGLHPESLQKQQGLALEYGTAVGRFSRGITVGG